ncbi:MAG: type II toxin-antitoxin system RelE/ParE family toxin [Deltaproteobacteria bacterium]|nr:type II toxin-antitoxin system RelE/ParE family toxin [Deltaproteobacteria bacterium]
MGDYIAKADPERAIEFVRRLLDSTSHLETFPMSGSLCREDRSCRHVVVTSYRVIYEVTDRGVQILIVLKPGQSPIRFK